MKLKTFISLLALFLLVACNKKEYPKDSIESSDATFYSSLRINGAPVNLEAGKDSYYMYSSYEQDSTGLYSFVGSLSQSNENTSSPNTLKIRITDSQLSTPNGASNISNSIKPGDYAYYESGFTGSYGIEFESSYNKTPKSYLWDFGDGSTSSEANPTHQYKQAGSYVTCLSIDGTSMCRSTICNVVSIGNNSFNTYITASNQANNTVQFSSTNLGGKKPFTYVWSFGDGTISQLASPSHVYSITGAYPVKLQTTDSLGRKNEIFYNLVTSNDISSCASNFKLKSILPFQSNSNLSKVFVTYTDANGIVYTSDSKSQTGVNNFKILSVSDFEINEKGEKTKKIKLNFTCQVFAGSSALNIESSDCIICVSYK